MYLSVASLQKDVDTTQSQRGEKPMDCEVIPRLEPLLD